MWFFVFFFPLGKKTLVYVGIAASPSSRILTWLWCLLGPSRSQFISLTWEEITLYCPLASLKSGTGDVGWFLLDLGVDLARARVRWVEMEEDMGCICVLGEKALCVSAATSFQVTSADICEFSVNSFSCATANAEDAKDLRKCWALTFSIRLFSLKGF